MGKSIWSEDINNPIPWDTGWYEGGMSYRKFGQVTKKYSLTDHSGYRVPDDLLMRIRSAQDFRNEISAVHCCED